MRAPDHWAALTKLLPTGADLAWFQRELAAIRAQDSVNLEQQRSHYLDRVRVCDEALANLPIDQDGILTYRAACQAQADFIARRHRQWKLWRQVELIVLAKRAGISLSYTSK